MIKLAITATTATTIVTVAGTVTDTREARNTAVARETPVIIVAAIMHAAAVVQRLAAHAVAPPIATKPDAACISATRSTTSHHGPEAPSLLGRKRSPARNEQRNSKQEG